MDQRDDLHAGRTPRVSGDGLTVAELCNKFLNTKGRLLKAGEITDRTFRAYYDACSKVVNTFGRNRLAEDLAADDFESFRSSLADSLGPVSLGNEINKIRMIFKHGFDQSLIDRTIRYGQSFNKPSRKVLRISRANSGPRMFGSDELRTILMSASPPLEAMVLMAINCGFGQGDLAKLPASALDLKNGWVDFARPKTGVERRCPLWPETVAAVRDAIANRPDPRLESDANLCFLTSYGNSWVRMGSHADPGKRAPMDVLARMLGRFLKKLGINDHRGFYAIRHSFATIGGESRDQVAVNSLMGHVDSSMDGV